MCVIFFFKSFETLNKPQKINTRKVIFFKQSLKNTKLKALQVIYFTNMLLWQHLILRRKSHLFNIFFYLKSLIQVFEHTLISSKYRVQTKYNNNKIDYVFIKDVTQYMYNECTCGLFEFI
jgi:hypothetical protein